jgi:hypothetical protein
VISISIALSQLYNHQFQLIARWNQFPPKISTLQRNKTLQITNNPILNCSSNIQITKTPTNSCALSCKRYTFDQAWYAITTTVHHPHHLLIILDIIYFQCTCNNKSATSFSRQPTPLPRHLTISFGLDCSASTVLRTACSAVILYTDDTDVLQDIDSAPVWLGTTNMLE